MPRGLSTSILFARTEGCLPAGYDSLRVAGVASADEWCVIVRGGHTVSKVRGVKCESSSQADGEGC